MDELIRATTAPGVDVVPASSWLVGADRALAGEPGAETILRRALERLPTDRWDFAFLDCPPGLGLLAVSALTATSALLVPVEASTIALAGLAGLLKTVQAVQDRLNPALHLSAILVCRVGRADEPVAGHRGTSQEPLRPHSPQNHDPRKRSASERRGHSDNP